MQLYNPAVMRLVNRYFVISIVLNKQIMFLACPDRIKHTKSLQLSTPLQNHIRKYSQINFEGGFSAIGLKYCLLIYQILTLYFGFRQSELRQPETENIRSKFDILIVYILDLWLKTPLKIYLRIFANMIWEGGTVVQ